MARGTALEELVRMFRAEVGQSLSAAQGQSTVEAIQYALRRVQERLYADYTWNHLNVVRDKTMSAGQRYYSYPSDLSFDRLSTVTFRAAGSARSWDDVAYGITDAHYNVVDSDADEREDEVRRWQIYEGNQLEVWPIPAVNGGILRLRGVKALAPLEDPQDAADLDDQLIVMFAAAEYLAKQKQPNAKLKLDEAMAHYDRLKGNTQKAGSFRIGANSDRTASGPNISVRAPGT